MKKTVVRVLQGACLALAIALAAPSAGAQQGTQRVAQQSSPDVQVQQIPSVGGTPNVPDRAVAPAASVGAHAGPELSPWSMFLSADILVKAVMISLAFASLTTWT